jgi:hypothetical protein
LSRKSEEVLSSNPSNKKKKKKKRKQFFGKTRQQSLTLAIVPGIETAPFTFWFCLC